MRAMFGRTRAQRLNSKLQIDALKSAVAVSTGVKALPYRPGGVMP